MKSIVKPIKKGRNMEQKTSSKAAMLGTLILSGVIALSASGCTAEIKMADGTPVGTVVINDEALATGITVNQPAANVVKDPETALPEDNFDEESEPSGSSETEATDPVEPSETEPVAAETTAAPTAEPTKAPATPTAEPTKVSATATPTATPTEAPSTPDPKELEGDDSLGSFSYIPNRTVINFNKCTDAYCLEGEYDDVRVTLGNDNTIRFKIFGKEYDAYAPCSELSHIYLLKDYGMTFVYIQFTTDEGPAIYAYELTDTSAKLKGVVENTYFEGKVDNPRYFWVVETYGKGSFAEIRRNYEFSSFSGMPVPKDGMIATFYTHNNVLKATRDMKGYVVKNYQVDKNHEVTIKAGDIVTPYQTDEHNYIDVKTQDGTIVRVDFTTEYVRYFVKDDFRWLYKAVDTMFDFA